MIWSRTNQKLIQTAWKGRDELLNKPPLTGAR